MKCILGSITCLLLITFITGCSHSSPPVAPVLRETAEPSVTTAESPHNLLGLYTFVCDPDSGSVDAIPIRDAEFHLNALKFLEPPPYLHLTLESPPEFNGNVLDVDIGLRHPFLGQDVYTGFDVCGIVFTHGSVTGFSDPDIVIAWEGDTRLLNRDGYTRWWNPKEFPHGDTIYNYKDGLLGNPVDTVDFNCTINGYKYFADGLVKEAPLTVLEPAKRGVFSAGKKNIRHYTIDISGGLIFNYAVDACWKWPPGGPPYVVPDSFPPDANRPEAWNVSVTELENSLTYNDYLGSGSGGLKLLVDVWDHFGAYLNQVHAESLAGLPLTTALTPIGGGEGYSTYQLDFMGDNLNQSGNADLLISVQSEESGYGGILPGKPVYAYFIYPFKITPEGPKGWARTWGGEFSDFGNDVAADNFGNIYVTGSFRGIVDFDPNSGVEERISNGTDDVYLSKFNSNGEFQWVQTWGGVNKDYAAAITVDNSGNIYLTGDFRETVDFDPGPGLEEHTSNGYRDIFLSKFNPNGDFQWAKTWGGEENLDKGRGITVDDSGYVYVTGNFQGTADFDPGPGVDEHKALGLYNRDAFISKFNSTGDFQWARTWGSWDGERGCGVAVDDSGDVYIAGHFYSDVVDFDPGPGVDEHTMNGICDAYLSKFNSNGDFLLARTWGGEKWDYGHSVALDDSGNIYMTGSFRLTVDFDPDAGIEERISNGESDVFLSKFNPNGNFIWVCTWGGEGDDWGSDIVIDDTGNLYVTGIYEEIVDFDPGPGIDERTPNGLRDVFLSKFDLNGNFIWARTWGGEGPDYSYGVAVDNFGNVYISGYFLEVVDFDPGPGIDEHISNGDWDAFLSKFPPDGDW